LLLLPNRTLPINFSVVTQPWHIHPFVGAQCFDFAAALTPAAVLSLGGALISRVIGRWPANIVTRCMS